VLLLPCPLVLAELPAVEVSLCGVVFEEVPEPGLLVEPLVPWFELLAALLSLCGVVLMPEVPVAEAPVLPEADELVEGVVEDEEDVVSLGEVLEGDVLDALPVEQVEETMLALSTLMVLPLAVPVTETVWPTWSLKAALFFDCSVQVLPLLSVKVKLSPEPPMQPCTVWDPEVDEDEEAPVALWSEDVLGVVEDPVEDEGFDWFDCDCDEVDGWVLLVPV